MAYVMHVITHINLHDVNFINNSQMIIQNECNFINKFIN